MSVPKGGSTEEKVPYTVKAVPSVLAKAHPHDAQKLLKKAKGVKVLKGKYFVAVC